MIIVKLHSGLGNQLFQYAIGRNVSRRYGCELILETGRFATDDLRDFKLNSFQIQGQVVASAGSKKLLLQHPALFFKIKTRAFRDVQDNMWEPTALASIPDNSILNGYWTNTHYFSEIRDILLKEFSLKPERETAPYAEMKQKISGCESVALHIRRGDYLHDTNKNIFSLLPMEYYEKALHIITQKVAHPRFFIFSDSVSWVKNNFNLPEQHEIVSEHDLQDVHEFSLMRHCRHQVIANSTFSWWGAWLNAHPGKTVIAPKDWYVKPEAQAAYEQGKVLNAPEFMKL